MMWNPLKKKKIDPDRNIIDDLANSLQEKGEIENLETELKTIRQSDLNSKEVESWHHLYGICAFQRGDHNEASKRFKNGLIKCPESNEIKFSLAQEYIFLSKPEKAFPLFDECVFPLVSRDFALAMSRYAYLFSEYDRGIKYIENFFDIYKEVKILDDHFLYVRGLPFFGTAWSYLAAHCILSGNEEKLKTVTSDIAKICHDYDFDYLNKELNAILNNNYSGLIPLLIERRKESETYNGPTGYTDTMIAIFDSFNKGTFQEAMSALDSVNLSENDFHWLEDIRLLAKAKVANKFGEPQVENEVVENFLDKQSILFEPDHAVCFGLLEYQELLKPRVAIIAANK